MPNPAITNPFGVNAPQGNVVYTSKDILIAATDPAGNVQTITGISTANPGVVTTSVAHGYLTGQTVTISGVSAATANANGTFKITRLSATTFSIPVNVTGTYGSGGTTVGAFNIGQVVSWQGWNGSASSDTAASAYPTLGVTAAASAATNYLTAGVIIGGTQVGTPPIVGGSVQVVTQGIAAVLCDTTTSINSAIIQSAASPGFAKAGTAATGLNIGTALAAATYTAPTPNLVVCNVRLS